MIPLAQARTLALASARAGKLVRVPLLEALDHFLAEGISASRASPACDNSAMDGFALQHGDTRGARGDRPAILKVVGSVFAGSKLPDRDCRTGEAFRIFTGAPIPFGADAVVRQESAREDGHTVAIFAEAEPGENLRQRGEEFGEGSLLFSPGQRVDARVLGVLATVGQLTVRVRERPRVAILTVGDELVPLGQVAQPHQTYESNGVLLAALAQQAGARVISVEAAPDQDESIRRALEKELPACELIITTGGASVGQRDRTKQVIRAMGGTLGFEQVAMKPGRPSGLALLGQTPVAVLPGNPGAALVAFDQLVRPVLLKLQGVFESRRRMRAKLDSARRKPANLTVLVAARLEQKEGALWAELRPAGSGQLLRTVGADGWALLPAGREELAAGEEVEVELFWGASYQPVPPGDFHQEATR